MPAHRIAPQADRRHATLPTHISHLALAAVEPAAAPALRNGEDHIAVPAGNGRVRENAATGGGNGMPHVWSVGGKEFVEEQGGRCRIVAAGDSARQNSATDIREAWNRSSRADHSWTSAGRTPREGRVMAVLFSKAGRKTKPTPSKYRAGQFWLWCTLTNLWYCVSCRQGGNQLDSWRLESERPLYTAAGKSQII